MRRIPLLLLGLLCLLPVPARARPDPLQLALIIGHNRHLADPGRTLKYADLDAIRVAEQFHALEPDAELFLLIDPSSPENEARLRALDVPWQTPTWEHLTATVEALRQRVRVAHAVEHRGVILQVHTAAHGELDGSLHLEDRFFRPSEQMEAWQRIDADITLDMADRCHGANGTRGTSGPRMLTPVRRPAGYGLIGSNLAVPEFDAIQGSLLTMTLMVGKSGLADLDGDRSITFRELGQYVASQFRDIDNEVQIVVAEPRRDPLVPLVDLSQAPPIGVRLDRDFGGGTIQIVRERDQALVMQFFHHEGRTEDLRLEPGRYTLIRWLGAAGNSRYRGTGLTLEQARKNHVNAVDVIAIDARPGQLVTIDRRTAMAPRFAVPRSHRGSAGLPPDVELVAVSEAQEQLALGAPYRIDYDPRERLPLPAWALNARLENPLQGPNRAASPEGQSSADRSAPGVTVQLERTGSWLQRGRWLAGGGLEAGYSLRQYSHVWRGRLDGADAYFGAVLEHHVRLGALLRETLALPHLRLALEQSVAWAPGVVTEGANVARELDWDDVDQPISQWRYVLLTDVAAQASFSMLLPIGPLEIGPSIRGEALLFDRLSPGLNGQLTLGLEVRQSTLRWK